MGTNNEWFIIYSTCGYEGLEMDNAYAKYLQNANRSIPGQSLTNNPDQPRSFEKAPEITDLREAIEFLFVSITDEERYPILMQLVGDGIPVMEIVQVTLFQGFNQGKWNPDLVMLLAEPLAYMIMALAERANLEYTIYKGEEEEEVAEQRMLGTNMQEEQLKGLKSFSKTSQIPQGVLPANVVSRIESMPIEAPADASLLAQEETEEVVQ